ncbi:MAG: DRTGG domain-containing protein [Dehalococcoidia bacterium]|nr:DRTGG domain-containing protein [Dehalococcoidia bacterium]
MVSLYITSLGDAEGKTTFCAGIARQYIRSGKKVGFLKLVNALTASTDGGNLNADTEFFSKYISLEDAGSSVCVAAPADKMLAAATDAASSFNNKDLLIIEGLNIGEKDGVSSQQSADLARELKARVIIIAKNGIGLSIDNIVQACSRVKEQLAGVIVNAIPSSRTEVTRQTVSAALEKEGIKILGFIPENRGLSSVSVADLVEELQGEVLVNNDRLDEIVENLMIGAMTLDSGKSYFARKSGKVAIIRGERPDMMLAALHTSTRGIISTGDTRPSPTVLLEAEVKKVPVITVPGSTREVASVVEGTVVKARFHQGKKLDILDSIIEGNLDWKPITQELKP